MAQGLELALRVLVAAGATRVRTLQIGAQAILETPRAPDGELADPGAFEAYLAAVHAEGDAPSSVAVLVRGRYRATRPVACTAEGLPAAS